MRASSASQLRMSGGNGRLFSAAGSMRSPRTTMPIASRSSSASNSAGGVPGSSRA